MTKQYQSLGWAIVANDGPVRTGRYYAGTSAKIYKTEAKANQAYKYSRAKNYGIQAVIKEIFVEVDDDSHD